MVATTPGKNIPWHVRYDLLGTVPAALLALVMVYAVAQSIAAANWADGLEMLPAVVLPALLVGLAFARLAWLRGWIAHLLSATLGVVWSVQQVGPQLQREVARDYGPALAERLVDWGDRGSEVLIRLLIWGRTLQGGGRGEDVVLYVFALALLIWALGYTTGWLLFRSGHTWSAILLNAAVILVNYTYTWPKPDTLFFIFLGSALILLAFQQIVRQQRTWQAALVEYPASISWRFLTAAALFCAAVVLATSLLPSEVGNAEVARFWEIVRTPVTAAREGWETAFSIIKAPPGTAGGGFTVRSVEVGGGRVLNDAVVMRVRSSRFDYWRAVAFDRYTGHGWQSTVGERARAALGTASPELARTPIEVGISAPQIDLGGRRLVTQTVELLLPRKDRLLTIGGQFSSAGIPVLLQNGYYSVDGTLVPNFTETSSIHSELPLQASQTYTVSTYISVADEQSLREAGTDYPEWIAPYTQLPETVPPRVRERAREIVEAAGATNPYDQAVAIERELRKLTYDERRAAPPAGRDWVDYFVFDAQTGYCDDFSTAMIVLLRSLDVPARWAQGYAGGTIDPETGSYVVRESIAHSWPEVYFAGYGWQRFEPTPASYANVPQRPALPVDEGAGESDGVSPEGRGSVPNDRDLLQLDRELTPQGGDLEAILQAQEEMRQAELRRQLILAGVVLAALVAGAGIFLYSLRRSLRGLSPAAAAYVRMARLAGWAGVPHEQHATPYEYATDISRAVPEQRDPVERIAGSYVRERYGGAVSGDAESLERDVRAVRGSLLTRMLARIIPRPRR